MGVEEGLDCTHACRWLIAGEQAWTNQAEVELAESERILALSSLAFLPLPTVERAFDLVKMMFPVEERPVTECFEWTYIGINRPESTHQSEVHHAALFSQVPVCARPALDSESRRQRMLRRISIITNNWPCIMHCTRLHHNTFAIYTDRWQRRTFIVVHCRRAIKGSLPEHYFGKLRTGHSCSCRNDCTSQGVLRG